MSGCDPDASQLRAGGGGRARCCGRYGRCGRRCPAVVAVVTADVARRARHVTSRLLSLP